MSILKVGVVILDFLKAEQVVKNVETIFTQNLSENIELYVSVIDNSCNIKNAKILELGLKNFINSKNLVIDIAEKNIGYTAGNNRGVKNLEKLCDNLDYLFVINPDIETREKNVFQKMINYLEKNEEVGIIGPRQVHKNGEYAMSVRQFPNLFVQIFRRLWLRSLPFIKQAVEKDEMQKMDKAKTQDVDWLQSSFICIRKDLWDNIGGFNEKYFLFMADAEICLESWKRKKKVQFFSEVEVLADGIRCSGGGLSQFFKSWVLRQHLKDAWKYFVKHLFDGDVRKYK
jgi:GT2 family glycosyltransferase